MRNIKKSRMPHCVVHLGIYGEKHTFYVTIYCMCVCLLNVSLLFSVRISPAKSYSWPVALLFHDTYLFIIIIINV